MQTHPWTPKGCDLTEHAFSLNRRIHTVIVTRFSHNIQQGEMMFYTQNFNFPGSDNTNIL